MDDDLNTADGIRRPCLEMAREINTTCLSPGPKATVEYAAKKFDELADVLGLLYNQDDGSLDAQVEELIAKRQEARKNKDFKTADAIRDQLADMGIVLKRTPPQGVQWSRK